jgi:hypothetical protein
VSASARVQAFIDAWPKFSQHGDSITGLGGHGYRGELLCSDLRAILEDHDRLREEVRRAGLFASRETLDWLGSFPEIRAVLEGKS